MNWKRHEVECLKNNFPTTKDRELAKIIRKSPNALRIKASRLGISKEITHYRNNLKLNSNEKQVIIGGLLGDLHCRVNTTSKNACLEGGHCFRQKEYLLWKINLIQRLGCKIRKTKINTYLYQSRNFKTLNRYIHLFYNKGFKYITRPVLNLLDDFGLLIWYLDDGHYHKRDKNIRLCTNGFSFEEQQTIKDWFIEKYNIKPKIHKNKNPKNYPGKVWYYLYFTVYDTKKLINIFKKFEIPDCMKYKLGLSHSTI